jgi:hypothetical protein
LAAGFDSSGSTAVAGALPRKVDAPDVEPPVFDRDLARPRDGDFHTVIDLS